MDLTKYTTTELKNSLETLKNLHSQTGEPYYLPMIVAITEELSKR